MPLEKQPTSQLADKGERTLLIGGDQPIRISTGHRLLHHDGKCSRPHGHNYEISVEVTGTLTEEGWVVDKGDITQVIDDWDHRFLLEEDDPLIEAFQQSGDGDSLIVLEHPPTAEMMGVILERKLLETLPNSVSDVSVMVRETSELCAGATH
ncbi:6-pyruvoyl tetrahydropterin synthase family protein [Halobacterium salinarum]|uniref:6-pyruvoyl trahydropterin synthase family protein n=1 Tax=Halobacterium salinarum TaxID=2242 RepID=UPI0025563DF0|nr:6-pyruvoyl tetrahydropterin synthase family protein [Halobacterium salinarum]MDL0118547.1 6-pyruvoyl tetrahydropterin synthase family protein [Halobacterium salinarum]MDL0119169.1 6-pyruvoyl tetrahydropterin synthase family protein [Halobacterium salinarum]MDL0119792.1 6-pyruvoyl tetrahydropterin synthase family protein [Halobacterium salinarum]